ncbi:MAG: helix-turn-helix transcriptional regulator [Pseudomonadota bacterium]
MKHVRPSYFVKETTDSKWPPLTPRENEVLRWIALGKSNAGIADILGVSIHTVDTLCRRIMGKFETSSRVTAAVRAGQAGLLPIV